MLASDLSVFIGTYTRNSPSRGIYHARIDPASGELKSVSLATEMQNPSFIAFSLDGRFAYAIQEGSPEGNLVAFAVDDTGGFTELNSVPSSGAGACHVSITQDQRFVLVANYSGGNAAVFRIGEHGDIDERTSLVELSGSGPDPDRQKGPHAHSIHASADSRNVYVCDLGTDQIWIYQLDDTGTLSPADPPVARVPPGAGPRHLAFHPNGKWIYVINEMGLSVTVFERNVVTGHLALLATVAMHDPGARPDSAKGVEVACSPDGRFLYASSRGDDTLSVFEIAEDGMPVLRANLPTGVKTPRHFAIDPSGGWLIVGGQDDDKVVIRELDTETGLPGEVRSSAVIGSPVCFKFRPSGE